MIVLWIACTQNPTQSVPDMVHFESDLESLEQQVQYSLNDGLPSMTDVADGYVSLMSLYSESQCPQFNYTSNGFDGHWVDDCITEDGDRFNGFSSFSDIGLQMGENTPDFGEVFSTIWGSFDIIEESGDQFSVGGLGQLGIIPSTGGLDMNLNGAFWVDYSKSWMEKGSSSFQVHGSIYEELEISGGVNYPKVTMYFDSVIYDAEQCGGTVFGDILLRDATGYWFTFSKKSCQNCGVVMWEGYPVGQMCFGDSLDASVANLIEKVSEWYE
jgi:hypothetical protein